MLVLRLEALLRAACRRASLLCMHAAGRAA
jgi:hypothetical protein